MRKSEAINIHRVVKQASIFGPAICSTSTAKGNKINEKVQYNYVNVQIGMPVFVDDIATI